MRRREVRLPPPAWYRVDDLMELIFAFALLFSVFALIKQLMRLPRSISGGRLRIALG
jgi:hypothetical protein